MDICLLISYLSDFHSLGIFASCFPSRYYFILIISRRIGTLAFTITEVKSIKNDASGPARGRWVFPSLPRNLAHMRPRRPSPYADRSLRRIATLASQFVSRHETVRSVDSRASRIQHTLQSRTSIRRFCFLFVLQRSIRVRAFAAVQ